MNIFILLKSLDKNTRYEVPKDGVQVKLDSHEAGIHLKNLWSFYKIRDQKISFSLAPAIEFPVWDSMLRDMVIRKLVKVECEVKVKV